MLSAFPIPADVRYPVEQGPTNRFKEDRRECGGEAHGRAAGRRWRRGSERDTRACLPPNKSPTPGRARGRQGSRNGGQETKPGVDLLARGDGRGELRSGSSEVSSLMASFCRKDKGIVCLPGEGVKRRGTAPRGRPTHRTLDRLPGRQGSRVRQRLRSSEFCASGRYLVVAGAAELVNWERSMNGVVPPATTVGRWPSHFWSATNSRYSGVNEPASRRAFWASA